MLQRQNSYDGTPSEKRQGLLWSTIVHILIFTLILTVSFKVRTPVPPEEGLLVNFGFDETGSGLFEPEPSPQQAPAAAIPDNVDDRKADEAIVTQDFEEAAEVKKAQPDPEAERRKQEAEAERKRLEQERQERLRKEEEQRRLNDINNRTRNAFGNTGNTGQAGQSEGIAGGTGNQGVESGTVGVRNYGPGGGTGNTGVSFDLAGRKEIALPVPQYDYQGEGKVVVEVTVDKSGTVTKAVAGVKGSTTLDDYLLRVAREAALKARFDANPNAPVIQKGTITYIFKLK